LLSDIYLRPCRFHRLCKSASILVFRLLLVSVMFLSFFFHSFKFCLTQSSSISYRRYVEVEFAEVKAGLPVASRLVLHSHAEIKVGYRQSCLTPTSAYRRGLVSTFFLSTCISSHCLVLPMLPRPFIFLYIFLVLLNYLCYYPFVGTFTFFFSSSICCTMG
jgi:hypothetical protein